MSHTSLTIKIKKGYGLLNEVRLFWTEDCFFKPVDVLMVDGGSFVENIKQFSN